MTRVRRLSLLLTLFVLAPFATVAEQVKLRLTSQLPASSHIGVNLAQFKDEVERRTDKAIAIEIFDNSRLYKDDEVVGAVSSAAIEMGLVASDHFVEKIPAIGIFQQPFLFNFEALVRAAMSPDRETRRLIDKAIHDVTGTRVLWWLPFGSTVFLSKGKPAISPTEISNRKIRVVGKTMAIFTKQCGGIPEVLAASDQLKALQDGTIDMTMTGVSGVPARNLWKATDTITRTDHATFEMLVIIHEAVWQRLSESHKTIITEVARKVEQDLRDRISEIEADAYRFAREKGMKVYDLTPDEVAEWRACSSPVLEAFMTDAGDLARQLLGAYGKLRIDPCCSSGPAGSFYRR